MMQAKKRRSGYEAARTYADIFSIYSYFTIAPFGIPSGTVASVS